VLSWRCTGCETLGDQLRFTDGAGACGCEYERCGTLDRNELSLSPAAFTVELRDSGRADPTERFCGCVTLISGCRAGVPSFRPITTNDEPDDCRGEGGVACGVTVSTVAFPDAHVRVGVGRVADRLEGTSIGFGDDALEVVATGEPCADTESRARGDETVVREVGLSSASDDLPLNGVPSLCTVRAEVAFGSDSRWLGLAAGSRVSKSALIPRSPLPPERVGAVEFCANCGRCTASVRPSPSSRSRRTFLPRTLFTSRIATWRISDFVADLTRSSGTPLLMIVLLSPLMMLFTTVELW